MPLQVASGLRSKVRDVVLYIYSTQNAESISKQPQNLSRWKHHWLQGPSLIQVLQSSEANKMGHACLCACCLPNRLHFCIWAYYGGTTTDSLCCPALPFTCRIVLHLLQNVQEPTPVSGYTDCTRPQCLPESYSQRLLLTGTMMMNRKQMPHQLKKKRKKWLLACKETRTWCLPGGRCVKSQCSVQPTMHLWKKYQGSKWEDRQGHWRNLWWYVTLLKIHFSGSWWNGKESSSLFSGVLLVVLIVKSFILMRMQLLKEGQNEQRHPQYRRNQIEQLVGDIRAPAKKWGPSARVDCEERSYISSTRSLAEVARTALFPVTAKQKGAGKKVFRNTCSSNPGLHPGECFERFHTLPKYCLRLRHKM